MFYTNKELIKLVRLFINYETQNLRKTLVHSKIHIQPVNLSHEIVVPTLFFSPTLVPLLLPSFSVPPLTTPRAQRRKCVVKYLTRSLCYQSSTQQQTLSRFTDLSLFLCPSICLSPFTLSLFRHPRFADSMPSYEHPVLCIIKCATPTSGYLDFMGNPWMK